MINKLKNIRKVLRTVSHLKPIQVAYQLKYRLCPSKHLSAYSFENPAYRKLKFIQTPEIKLVNINENEYKFTFLNLTQNFYSQVNWSFQGFGKLWNYNLQYMDWLKQSSLEVDVKNALAINLYKNLWNGSLVLEPYPASLRIMNAIRYISVIESADQSLVTFIKSEANFLINRLEYHLLANHLLENAFAIYMAGSFFNEGKWIQAGEKLLREELNEQILEDGAHFELSPMYHQIIFYRVLELLAYENPDSNLYAFVKQKATKMLSWLKKITFKNGEIPHFNDSTNGIALSSAQLFDLAAHIGLKDELKPTLKDSGYRKFENTFFELLADVNGISPSYQPGHAHADTFTFCLNFQSKPIIVDPGISTYDLGKRRDLERSTYFHNTINVNKKSSAEVWAGFRVGKRLNVNILNDSATLIEAIHDGYKRYNVNHKRAFQISQNKIEIIDQIIGHYDSKNTAIQACLHFHPDVNLELIKEGEFLIDDRISLQIIGVNKAYIMNYDYCIGYNKFEKANKILIMLEKSEHNLTTIFEPRV